MKHRKQIERRVFELALELKGSEGSKAHRLRGQIEVLQWVLE